ncbi:hypothetical protein NDU88_002458 [Pleurodeles waltl]|uniref:Uncharacterized protein n=1 Tax=Pleurodeles waltl TaxID=8319 RepID=A0AAV7LCK2_PLEWA|nr:hypothetical protein NDU88_002458 [Pleurodeles waltl]
MSLPRLNLLERTPQKCQITALYRGSASRTPTQVPRKHSQTDADNVNRRDDATVAILKWAARQTPPFRLLLLSVARVHGIVFDACLVPPPAHWVVAVVVPLPPFGSAIAAPVPCVREKAYRRRKAQSVTGRRPWERVKKTSLAWRDWWSTQ